MDMNKRSHGCALDSGVLGAIGKTPMVQLHELERNAQIRLFAKLEALNPGGSAKDRSAVSMVWRAMERGDLSPGGTVIESSSGNMGIGLAQACARLGVRFVCVTDERTTQTNMRILELYGAVVHVVKQSDCNSTSLLQERLRRVQLLLAEYRDGYWPNQYENIDNPLAHNTTMREIAVDLGGAPDYLICAVSTCGTLRGCIEYIKRNSLGTTVIAVDSCASSIFGETRGERLIPGLGAAVSPALCRLDPMPTCIRVSDLDCIKGCRILLRKEAILAGGSSGGVVSGYMQFATSIPGGNTCVLILADRGERYLDSIYSDAWVTSHFGAQAISGID